MGDVADVMDIVMGFEEHNTVRIAIELTVGRLGHVPRLMLYLQAYRPVGIGVEPAPLASVLCDCQTMNLRTLRDAVIRGLYALDIQLALQEFGGEPETT